jgi:hypothetical protein
MSLIVPFLGSESELAAVAERFSRVALGPGDELLIVDNGRRSLRPPRGTGARVIHAGKVRSSYFARNAGAKEATGEWFVFCDADVDPAADLLDAYLEREPAERTGVLAGGVQDHVEGTSLAARLARETSAMSQRASLGNSFMPYAITANCAVRAEAFREAEGFEPLVRSGGDADLCWRLQRLGWELEERPGARVDHRNRSTMRELWSQRRRHGSGAAWLGRRYPGAMPPWSAPALIRDSGRRLASAARSAAQGDREAAALDAAIVSGWWAFELGRYTSNRARS